MAKHEYDKILTRLIGILAKLFNGERIKTKDLALEFNVNIRTIQKDMQRLRFFPIQGGYPPNFEYYMMEGFNFEKVQDIKNDEIALLVLALGGINNISQEFELLKKSIFAKMLPLSSMLNPYYIKHEIFQNLDTTSRVVDTIEEAISKCLHLSFSYNKNSFEVEPYKIVSFEGIWYLFCKDERDKKCKNLFLHLIKNPIISQSKFIPDRKFEKMIDNIHTAWFVDGESFEVVVKIHTQIAHFFKLKKHLSSQKIIDEYDDGTLLISFLVSHIEDVDNIIKSWLPHIEVITPKEYKNQLQKELQIYLENF